MLQVYNSLGRKLEEFKPLKAGEVKIYVCGPTVYSYLHIGNFRGQVFFNFVRNWLEHLGYKVSYSSNFTDVDDKIINRANEEGVSASEISERFINEYKTDFLALGLRPHDENPKVTSFMPQIIDFISDLIKKDKAYEANGDVNYAIDNFLEYGKLSNRRPEDLKEGVRIDVSEKKRSPLDFALWKTAKPNENLRGSSWSSPWGEGRPGWHIECSAMVKGLYGDQIDIHGGGLDLLFPHHENEIAQSEGCTGKTFSKYWMHWNMINFSGTKMSKSLGNVVTMREFLKTQPPEVYKWMMLSVHYRSVAEFSDATIDQAISGLARVYSALSLAESVLKSPEGQIIQDEKYANQLKTAWEKVENSFNDDFSTPAAFAVLFEQIRFFNTQVRRGIKINDAVKTKAQLFKEWVTRFGKLLALFQETPETFLIDLDNKLLEKMNIKRSDVDQLVLERSQARVDKDFKKSDDLRKKLNDMGISVSDLPAGSFWEVTK